MTNGSASETARRDSLVTKPSLPGRSGASSSSGAHGASSLRRAPDPFAAEAMDPADRGYEGTTFAEVRRALFANPYQRVWGRADEPSLPRHDVRLAYLLRGVLGGAPRYLFRQASARAVDSHADLRWGDSRTGFRRILHPNGIAMLGRWQITELTQYSGYFRADTTALIVARYSTCCTETRRGHTRSLALAGKLFPTDDPHHEGPLRTASVITQQDIGGDVADYINDVELRNAPNTTALRRGLGLPTLLMTGLVFNRVDAHPTIRQLYEIAELGKPTDEPTRAPAYLRLRVAPSQPRIEGDALDFRDEIMAQIYDRGDPTPRRSLEFEIDLTDDGQTRGPAFRERRTFQNWRRVGKITFTEAVASYNADFVLHFNHPTWRADRNDPATATRMSEQRARRRR